MPKLKPEFFGRNDLMPGYVEYEENGFSSYLIIRNNEFKLSENESQRSIKTGVIKSSVLPLAFSLSQSISGLKYSNNGPVSILGDPVNSSITSGHGTDDPFCKRLL